MLIVDADDGQAHALRDVLAFDGITASVACTGPAALAALELQVPDAALLELRLPGMNGYELLRQLRQRLPRLPALLTTGLPPTVELAAAFLAEPATAYIGKPIDLDALLVRLAQLVALRPAP